VISELELKYPQSLRERFDRVHGRAHRTSEIERIPLVNFLQKWDLTQLERVSVGKRADSPRFLWKRHMPQVGHGHFGISTYFFNGKKPRGRIFASGTNCA
jgi:hypothetical protein